MINWSNFRFHVRYDQRVGIIVSNVTYNDVGVQRDIMYQGNVDEIFVPYEVGGLVIPLDLAVQFCSLKRFCGLISTASGMLKENLQGEQGSRSRLFLCANRARLSSCPSEDPSSYTGIQEGVAVGISKRSCVSCHLRYSLLMESLVKIRTRIVGCFILLFDMGFFQVNILSQAQSLTIAILEKRAFVVPFCKFRSKSLYREVCFLSSGVRGNDHMVSRVWMIKPFVS